jgi:hypothetical protein
MSHVTNVIIAIGPADNSLYLDTPRGIEQMNAALHPQVLADIDACVGGSKNLEIGVWAGALNYRSPDQIVDAALSADWVNKDEVQLMICAQDDYLFTVKTLAEWERSRSRQYEI